jgi:hypothetical protein
LKVAISHLASTPQEWKKQPRFPRLCRRKSNKKSEITMRRLGKEEKRLLMKLPIDLQNSKEI